MSTKGPGLRICAVLLVLATAFPAAAANTNLGGVSTRARSMGNAFTALADDASSIYYNPAGLVQVDGTQLLMDVVDVEPSLRYQRSGSVQSESHRGALAPGLFLSSDVFKPAVLGIGLFAPYARADSYENNAAFFGVRQSSKLVRIDLAPTAAFKLGTDWALGIGVTGSRILVDSDVTVQNAALAIPPLRLRESMRGWGVTGQFGLLYRGFDRLQLGLDYRGRMNARVSGPGTLNSPGPTATGHQTSSLHFPDVLSAGAAWRPSDRWLLSAQVEWENWSYFDHFRRDYDNAQISANSNSIVDAHDAINLRIGTVYSWGNSNELRFGYTHQERATPLENIIPAQPDYGVHVFSVGVGKKLGRVGVNLTYEYNHAPTEHNRSTFFPGAYSLRVHTFSLSFTMNLGETKDKGGRESER